MSSGRCRELLQSWADTLDRLHETALRQLEWTRRPDAHEHLDDFHRMADEYARLQAAADDRMAELRACLGITASEPLRSSLEAADLAALADRGGRRLAELDQLHEQMLAAVAGQVERFDSESRQLHQQRMMRDGYYRALNHISIYVDEKA